MIVPLADLHRQNLSLKVELDAAISDVIEKSAFIRGEYVERFEEEFAALLGVRHCVSCGNGTDALYIAMKALKLQPGDEVITSAQSWIATSETITQAGGQVVFCDIDDTHTLCPEQLSQKITPRTVGIIPVHLYGQPADMTAITDLARRHGLWVIEDCAQAHLAKFNGNYVGHFGHLATFSFYPGKNLGAMGDAGAIITNDATLAKDCAIFARHGGLTKGEHLIEGINSRLDGIQAAILSVKLTRIHEWTRQRARIAALYDRDLGALSTISVPRRAIGREHVFHLYVIQSPDRDELRQHLSRCGVQTTINYPVALPFLPAYKRLGHRPEHFPQAHASQSQILSIPMFSEITEEERQAVVRAIREFDTKSARKCSV